MLVLTAVAAGGAFPSTASAADVPYGADPLLNTSEYGLGSYLWNIAFIQDNILRDPSDPTHPPDSGGQVIHWTQSELNVRMQRVNDAATFWNNQSAARHHPGARLNIQVNFLNGGQPLTIADIGGEGNSSGYDDALAQLDPSLAGLGASTAARRFARDTRETFDTNWAYTTFVKPYNGRASTLLNGPYSNGYEDDGAYTYAHESGHIFGARDEYGSASTDQRHGYLWLPNSNAVKLPDGSTNPASVPSLMRDANNWTLVQGSMDGFGWTDTDGDTIPDILDTFPTLLADDTASDPFEGVFRLAADARVTPLESPNPNKGDFTINTLTGAQFRVDGEEWLDLLPLDGLWGDYEESLAVEISALEPMVTHDIDLRIFNSVDNFTLQSFQFVVVPGLNGDFNNDGTVNAADYVVWRKNGGPQQEYDNWREHFGVTPGGGVFPGDLGSSVPEPMGLFLALFGGCVGCLISRRRQVLARGFIDQKR
jgi:hypothetical protein